MAKGGAFQMEGGVPALLAPEAGKGAFDDARAEAQATGRQQGLGSREVGEQTLVQAGQLAGLNKGELIAGAIQHMERKMLQQSACSPALQRASTASTMAWVPTSAKERQRTWGKGL